MCDMHKYPTARMSLKVSNRILYAGFNQIESMYLVKHNVAVVIKMYAEVLQNNKTQQTC